jgi:prophage tail gpP-like protein
MIEGDRVGRTQSLLRSFVISQRIKDLVGPFGSAIQKPIKACVLATHIVDLVPSEKFWGVLQQHHALTHPER